MEALRRSVNRGVPFGAAVWQRRTAARLRLAGILAAENDHYAARAELDRLEAARAGIPPPAQGAYDRGLLAVPEDELLKAREIIWAQR